MSRCRWPPGRPRSAWAGGGRPKPVSAGALELAQLEAATASGLVVVTAALLRLGVPGAGEAIRDLIVSAMPPFLDQQLVDPSNAGHAADPFQPPQSRYGRCHRLEHRRSG